jgi:hypothetical protein
VKGVADAPDTDDGVVWLVSGTPRVSACLGVFFGDRINRYFHQ